MTYRELIIYVLENGLENEEVFQNGKIPGFKTIEETAVECGVGIETVKAWIGLEYLKTIKIGNIVYIPSMVKVERGI